MSGSANYDVDTTSSTGQHRDSALIDLQPEQDTPEGAARSTPEPAAPRSGARRRLAALSSSRMWLRVLMVLAPFGLLFYLYLRVATTSLLNSDGANSALQGWDLVHGNLLLHGWVIGDATYYAFELPIFGLCETVVGIGPEALRLGDTIVYFLVAAAAALLACRTNGAFVRGRTAAVRCGIVMSFLAVPLTVSTILVMMNAPDHIGTCAILLLAIYLADLAGQGRYEQWRSGRGRRLPIWLGVVLLLGQMSDATVLYVGVVPIALVSGFRMVKARRIRSTDGLIALAAILSYPAELLTRVIFRALGGYTMVPPLTQIAPISQWGANASITWHNLGVVYGILPGNSVTVTDLATQSARFLGWAAAIATVVGFALVVRRWRTAGRGAQILTLAIVVNVVSYTVSTIPDLGNAREIVFVLPAGAVLAAWACGERLFARRWVAVVATAALALTAYAPLVITGNRTIDVGVPRPAIISQWLEAHHLTYGIGGYWDASAETVESGEAVQVRAVWLYQGNFFGYSWEAKADWYDPTQHDAQFFITDPTDPANEITPAEVEAVYGKPVATYTVDTRVILVYDKNLLDKVGPLVPGLG